MWYWQKDSHIGEWNKMKNPEIYPHKYAKLFLAKVKK